MLKKLDKRFEEVIMSVLLIGIALIIFLQIIMRLMRMSLSWPEELARYFYVWSVFLSLAYTIRTKTNLRVELLVNFFPRKLQKGTEVLLQLINASFFATLFYFSIGVVMMIKGSNQTSPAMEIPMYLVYMVVPAGFFLAAFRALQQAYLNWVNFRGEDEGRPRT